MPAFDLHMAADEILGLRNQVQQWMTLAGRLAEYIGTEWEPEQWDECMAKGDELLAAYKSLVDETRGPR